MKQIYANFASRRRNAVPIKAFQTSELVSSKVKQADYWWQCCGPEFITENVTNTDSITDFVTDFVTDHDSITDIITDHVTNTAKPPRTLTEALKITLWVELHFPNSLLTWTAVFLLARIRSGTRPTGYRVTSGSMAAYLRWTWRQLFPKHGLFGVNNGIFSWQMKDLCWDIHSSVSLMWSVVVLFCFLLAEIIKRKMLNYIMCCINNCERPRTQQDDGELKLS